MSQLHLFELPAAAQERNVRSGSADMPLWVAFMGTSVTLLRADCETHVRDQIELVWGHRRIEVRPATDADKEWWLASGGEQVW